MSYFQSLQNKSVQYMPSAAQQTSKAELVVPELQPTILATLTGDANFLCPGTALHLSGDADCETCKGQFLIQEPPCFHWMCSYFKTFAAL